MKQARHRRTRTAFMSNSRVEKVDLIDAEVGAVLNKEMINAYPDLSTMQRIYVLKYHTGTP